MLRLFGDHTVFSAFKRLLHLVRGAGISRTLSVFASVVDDQYLRCFDRKYRVRTSGIIKLASTGFETSRLRDATQYGPVNGWAFRRLLRELNLPRKLHFADLGCGLGRACLLAGEYGFEKVTGVELAPDLCAGARENVARCRLPAGSRASITILQMDVLDFCQRTDDDVFFMFRPFSWEFLDRVLHKLAERAVRRQKPLTIVYSERMLHADPQERAISQNQAVRKVYEAAAFGQAFFVYDCGNQFAKSANHPNARPAPA
jgi:SAM-dependent methyltransferase